MSPAPAASTRNEVATRDLVSLPHRPRDEPVGSAMKQAVIYLRVSTAEQADNDYDSEGFSIPAQRDACTRKAAQMGATVVGEYVDRGESARSAARPQLQAMLGALTTEATVDYVIVHKVDRLARSREDDLTIGMRIRRSGAQLVSATENIDETPGGKLMHGIMASIAEFYSSNLSAEARKGLQEKARRGGTVSRAPLGYMNVREEFEGRQVSTVVIDERRREHIEWAFDEFATGEWTLAQMTDALEDRGLTSRPTRRYPEGPVSRSRIHKMLRNPYYIGLLTYDGAQYPGRHDALISTATFNAVQEVLDQRSKGKEKPVARTHYLKGMLACGQCRSRLGILVAKGKGGEYPYFFCLGRHGHRKNGCELPYIPVHEVEAKVVEMLKRFEPPEEHLAAIEEEVLATIELVGHRQERVVEQQRVQLQRVDAEERKLLEAYYADAITVTLLKSEQDRLRKLRTVAQEQVDRLTVELDSTRSGLGSAVRLLRNCGEVFERVTDQTRRALCFAFYSRIWVGLDGQVWWSTNEPFGQLVEPDTIQELRAYRANERALLDEAEEPQKRESEQPQAGPLARSLFRVELDGESESGQGFNLGLLVGVAGFEPTTSASRTQRSAKLSHTPVLCGGPP